MTLILLLRQSLYLKAVAIANASSEYFWTMPWVFIMPAMSIMSMMLLILMMMAMFLMFVSSVILSDLLL